MAARRERSPSTRSAAPGAPAPATPTAAPTPSSATAPIAHAGDGTAPAGTGEGGGLESWSGRYSRMSPGWHSRARQIPSRVEKRMALALPFFRMERLAIVMPTRSASSETRIFRLASITSMLTIVATDAPSDREVVFRLEVGGALEDALEHGGPRRGHEAGEAREDAHRDAAGAVVGDPEHDVGLGADDEPDDGQGAVLDAPHGLDGDGREGLAPAHVAQQLERLDQPEEERERPQVDVEDEGVEIHGHQVGVPVHALDLRLPDQAGQHGDADEQEDRPQEKDRAALHEWHLSWVADSEHSSIGKAGLFSLCEDDVPAGPAHQHPPVHDVELEAHAHALDLKSVPRSRHERASLLLSRLHIECGILPADGELRGNIGA